MYKVTFKKGDEEKTFEVKATDAQDAHEWANKQTKYWKRVDADNEWDVVDVAESEDVSSNS